MWTSRYWPATISPSRPCIVTRQSLKAASLPPPLSSMIPMNFNGIFGGGGGRGGSFDTGGGATFVDTGGSRGGTARSVGAKPERVPIARLAFGPRLLQILQAHVQVGRLNRVDPLFRRLHPTIRRRPGRCSRLSGRQPRQQCKTDRQRQGDEQPRAGTARRPAGAFSFHSLRPDSTWRFPRRRSARGSRARSASTAGSRVPGTPALFQVHARSDGCSGTPPTATPDR